MKKLLLLISLLICLKASAQIAAVNDTTRISAVATYSPQFVPNIFNSGGVNYRVTYMYNPSTAKYDAVIYSKYLRQFYVAKGDSNNYATHWWVDHANHSTTGNWLFNGRFTIDSHNVIKLKTDSTRDTYIGTTKRESMGTGLTEIFGIFYQSDFSTGFKNTNKANGSGKRIVSLGYGLDGIGPKFKIDTGLTSMAIGPNRITQRDSSTGHFRVDSIPIFNHSVDLRDRLLTTCDTGSSALPSLYNLEHRTWNFYQPITTHNGVTFTGSTNINVIGINLNMNGGTVQNVGNVTVQDNHGLVYNIQKFPGDISIGTTLYGLDVDSVSNRITTHGSRGGGGGQVYALTSDIPAAGTYINNSGVLQTGALFNVSKATITGSTPASVSTSSGTNAPTSFVFTPPNGGATSNSGSFAAGGNASDWAVTMGKGGSPTNNPTTGVGGGGGNIYFLSGDAGDPTGTTKIPGAAGEFIAQGGLSSAVNGAVGGNTSIKGGNGYTAANTSGGNVYFVAGQGHGTGLDGSIYSNVSAGGTVRGNMVIAATIDDRLHRLQVTGSAKFTDTVISPRFYITGTGDVATLINKKLDTSVYNKSSVNVYKYGVLGDSTNSAARINAVIQFAATNKTGTVIIPRGTYLLERSISVPSHIHLQIDRNAKFILNSGANSYLIQQSDIVNGNEDIWIDGGYFNGNGVNQTTNITSIGNLATDYYGFGFMFHKVNGLRIEHVEIDSTRTFAILAGGNRATIRDLKVMQRYSTSTYNGDGVKFIGSNVYFSDAVLATNDDGWSITPGDNCLGYIPNQGNATNFNIDNINYVAIDTSASKKLDPNNYSARAGRILTVRGDTLTRINITNLNGKVHYGVLNFSTAYPTLTAGGGMYDINVSNVNVKVMDNAPFIGLKGSFRFERGYAYNVNFNNITCSTDYNIPMFFSTLFNVNNVNVSNTIFKTKPGVVTQMWQDSLSNTQRLNITNAYVGDSTLATSGVLLYKKQGNSTWSNSTVFKAGNIQINDAGATVTSNSAGTNAKISFNGISFNVDTAQLFPVAGDVVKNSTKGIGNYYNSKWNWNNNYQQLTGTNTNNSAITFSKNQIFSKYVSMGGSYSNTSGWGTINNGGTTTTRPVIIFADNTNAAAGGYLGLAIGTNDLVTGTVVNDWVSRIPGTKWWWGNNTTAEMSLSSAGVLNLPQLGVSGLVGTDASHNISIITSLPSATSLVSPLLTGAGAGTTTLIYGNSATTGGSYTFPATSTSQTVASLALAQTFTNKTLTSPQINTPLLNTTSVVGQVWTASNTAGAGGWATSGVPIHGNSTTTGTATTAVTVTITTQANTNYYVGIAPQDLLTAVNWYISAKTTTSFTVTFVTPLTGSINFDYEVIP